MTNASLSFVISLLLLATQAIGQELTEPIALAQLAAQADTVALVRVSSTDYVYRRGFPYRGSALLEVLIHYKGENPSDMLEVYEEGLHPFECYFPDPPLPVEGRRYLVFLERDPEEPERFRGMPQGCALDILVNSENRYAVRLPVDGVELSDQLRPLAQEMAFADRYAVEDEDAIKPARRDALLLSGDLEALDGRYRYTRGIPLEVLRPLMEPGIR